MRHLSTFSATDFEVLLIKAGHANAGEGAQSSFADGKLIGDGFVVDHIMKGESIQEVLSRANNQVSLSLSCQTMMPGKCKKMSLSECKQDLSAK